MAVDGSGNVYVSDEYNTTLTEIPFGCTSTAYSANPCTVLLGGGFTIPNGVAVDGIGNVYVSDSNDGVVKEMPVTCTSALYSTAGCTITTLGGKFNSSVGVAVDESGNVYVADSAQTAIGEIPSGCTSAAYAANTCKVITLGGGFAYPTGVAVDGSGNLYVADTDNDAVQEVMSHGANLGSVAVGTSSTPNIPLTFTFTGAGTINAPVVLTGGAPNLDFADAGTGSCDTNGASHSYDVGQTCTVNVTFTPKFAGERNGGVELLNSSGSVIANGYVYGAGVGPQVAFGPATQHPGRRLQRSAWLSGR